jgi:hypothetical protein
MTKTVASHHASGGSDAVDLSDVPTVSVRELVLAEKLLRSAGGALEAAHLLTEEHLTRVEAAYWMVLARRRTRKTAVLLRFRALTEVCRARRLAGLMAVHGEPARLQILAAAAGQRLNTSWGFNPLKVARAVDDALSARPAIAA